MNRRVMQGAFVAAVTVATLSVAGPVGAQSTSDAQRFGRHVANCAHGTGFTGAHNPSMHRGPSGWDSSEECPS